MEYEQIQAEIRALKSLLADTDYNSSELIESLVASMESVTPENFITRFMEWLNTTIAQHGELIRSRTAWRDRINELEAMLPVDDNEVN